MPTFHKLSDLATACQLRLEGDGDLLIRGLSEPQSAGDQHLALAMKPGYAAGLTQGSAKAAILWNGADWQALGLKAAVFAARPRAALAGLSSRFDAYWRPAPVSGPAIHPSAVIDPSATIGSGAIIGPLCVIGPEVSLGADAWLGAGVTIGTQAVIKAGATLRDGVRIGPGVMIGSGFIAQPGVVVGGDGFSFATEEPSGVEAVRDTLGSQTKDKGEPWLRIHSLGGVTLGDDVEIGANSAIDRGTIRDTYIGDRTKLDNLVHIGHNVVIGQDCLICGQVGIAGSATLGNFIVLAGQTGVSDNIFVGDRVITGGATKLMSNVPAGRVMLGYPATKMDSQVESYKALRRLPRALQDIAKLKTALGNQGAND